MRIHFDPDFDGAVYNGPHVARAGETWVGPLGFTRILELQLGRAAPAIPREDRITAVVARLFEPNKFYSASAHVDPWGTAQRLLSWRDTLWAAGWRGEPLGQPRLEQLSAATADIAGAIEDRLATLDGALRDDPIHLDSIALYQPREGFDAQWRTILETLELKRIPISVDHLARHTTHDQTADALMSKSRDIQLARPYGALDAARRLAAGLAANPVEPTIIIGADDILASALAEAGLPSPSTTIASPIAAALEIVPLTIELAWGPVDPRLVQAWLTLPWLPISRSLGRRLARALGDWPVVGDHRWNAQLDEFFATHDESPDHRELLRSLTACNVDDDAPIRTRDLLIRVDWLTQWTTNSSNETTATIAALTSRIRQALVTSSARSIERSTVRSVVRRLTDAHATRPTASNAGIHYVSRPGAIVHNAERVVWWRFLADASSRPRRLPLAATERAALEDSGVLLPAVDDALATRALRQRRPVIAAKQLLLVAPLRDERGDRAHPHAVWDQLQPLVAFDPPAPGDLFAWASTPPRTTTTRLALPSPTSPIPLAQPVSTARRHSATSLSTLIACPFKYVLDYVARTRPRLPARPQMDPRTFGTIAHEELAERIAPPEPLSSAAPDKGATLWDLPELRDKRSELAGHVDATQSVVSDWITRNHLTVFSAEETYANTTDGIELNGQPDLVLAMPNGERIVIDYKWGSGNRHREALANGTAMQLAVYAQLLNDERVVAAGYVIVREQRLALLGVDLPPASEVTGPTLDETWQAVRAAVRSRQDQLKKLVVIPDAPKPFAKGTLSNGALKLPAPCRYCDHAFLCGRGYQDQEGL